MADRPITNWVTQFLQEHRGYVLEEDLIEAISVLALSGGEPHRVGSCTETSPEADSFCGARSLVELAMNKIHRR